MPCRRPPEVLDVTSMSEEEKLADLIKGLLSAQTVNYSRPPWASPIVVIINKNGVDMWLCIDYRLVNILTELMIYSMPLINDLLENLESTLWYCSLDMASGFWVVKMTDRAPLISACITPFGLFEMKSNALQLDKGAPDLSTYDRQRAIWNITENGEQVDPSNPSVLGPKSYIDGILSPAKPGSTM
ncbi:reverse transcriptase [Phytophthora megakarya]|uniref:Reverse transcriptase n=1 Tax=Phytophthora megakarya TaxID=4795 RepID=A0A225WRR6_9STRA|nr:reverse transcriptase [Phytophthora megakarya]